MQSRGEAWLYNAALAPLPGAVGCIKATPLLLTRQEVRCGFSPSNMEVGIAL